MAINRNRDGREFTRREGECARCGQTKELRARGLDAACWMAAKKDDTLADYPLTNRRLTDTAEDYQWLRRAGETHERAAERMGRNPESLRIAMWQARRVGLLEAS